LPIGDVLYLLFKLVCRAALFFVCQPLLTSRRLISALELRLRLPMALLQLGLPLFCRLFGAPNIVGDVSAAP
jgi:hypothetical protein